MKIVFIGGRGIHILGGIENYMFNLTRELAKLGHECIVWCESDHDEEEDLDDEDYDDEDDYGFDDEDDFDDEGFDFGDEDSIIYEVKCACGNVINFDEETLEEGSIVCDECGELLEFSLEDEDEE